MFRKQHPEIGARPGTLVISSDALPSRIRVVQYSRDKVREERIRDVAALEGRIDSQSITWVDVQGLGSADAMQALARIFKIHPLAMEDVVNSPQRPKAEPYDQSLLVIFRAVQMCGPLQIELEQVSLIVGPNYVLTFHDRYDDVLDPVRRRIRRTGARLRQHGSDYLAYAILDTVLDAYYPAMEALGDQLAQLEDLVIERPEPRLLRQLNLAKNRLMNLRRSIWPQREALQSLVRDEHPLISEPVRVFLRDTTDHCVQTSEVVEMYRDMVTGLLNTYLSSVGHRSNEVMKVLTIMSSIFVPLTFVAGIYGMNFEHMPELQVRWAYPAVWLMMASMVLGMLTFFRRKGWIGGSAAELKFETSKRPTVAGVEATPSTVLVLDTDAPGRHGAPQPQADGPVAQPRRVA